MLRPLLSAQHILSTAQKQPYNHPVEANKSKNTHLLSALPSHILQCAFPSDCAHICIRDCISSHTCCVVISRSTRHAQLRCGLKTALRQYLATRAHRLPKKGESKRYIYVYVYNVCLVGSQSEIISQCIYKSINATSCGWFYIAQPLDMCICATATCDARAGAASSRV